MEWTRVPVEDQGANWLREEPIDRSQPGPGPADGLRRRSGHPDSREQHPRIQPDYRGHSPAPCRAVDAACPPEGTRPAGHRCESDFGTILFDDSGQAIYLFDVETTSRPRCYGPCADAWPPVLTDGAPLADERVKESLLGTTRRTDGTTQVTYDEHPLYFYAHEGKDEVKCHNVFLNGGNWYAVQPDGQRAP